MTFQKLTPLRVPKFLLERVDNTEKRGDDIFFITLQMNYIYGMCVGKLNFPLLCFSLLS